MVFLQMVKKNRLKPEFINTNNTDGNKFVGIKGEDNKIKIFLPECFEVEENNYENDILLLLKCIKLSKILNSSENNKNSDEIKGSEFPITSYLWIIEDYKKNGILKIKEDIIVNGIKGRIDWRRTLQNPPLICNGNFIFTDFVSKYRTNAENLLIEIYKYCLKISIERIGWIFKLNSDFIELKDVGKNLNKLYISIVNKELLRTFDDTKRKRLENLKLILLNVDESKNINNFEYGTNSFHAVFEKMIDRMFKGLKDTTEFNPRGTWELDGIKPFDSSSMRPDTIIKDKKNIYIIDSKYYRYGVTKDIKNGLPETHSIQKQITYAKHIYEKTKKDNIFNAFLMPYNRLDKKYSYHGNICRIGFAKTNWNVDGKKYEKIHTFLIDLKYIINNYDKNNNDDIINSFKLEINQNI